jgi:hypothetical protein
MSKKKIPLAITLFGLGVVVTSLVNIVCLIDYNYYRYVFSFLPNQLIIARYLFSWFLLVLGFLSGLGILRLDNKFRKVTIGIFTFTALTVYWKYPYYAVKNHAAYLDQVFKNARVLPPYAPGFCSLAATTTVVLCAIDIIFSLCFIYYFTRQRVKNLFR